MNGGGEVHLLIPIMKIMKSILKLNYLGQLYLLDMLPKERHI